MWFIRQKHKFAFFLDLKSKVEEDNKVRKKLFDGTKQKRVKTKSPFILFKQ